MNTLTIIFSIVMVMLAIRKAFISPMVKNTKDIADNIDNDNTSSNTLDTILTTDNSRTNTAKPKRRQTAASQMTNSPKKSISTPKIAPEQSDEDAFDLKKAVIYSEILTPKYKDEEF